MDLSPITPLLFTTLWYLIPLTILSGILSSPRFKGMVGEAVVNWLAKRKLDQNSYRLVKNVTLPTEDGSTQIDHIIVSIYGVFVVETKNLRGWIFGGRHNQTWTQRIYRQAYKFQNPLRQNHKHCRTLADLLGLADHQIHSLIVFIGGSTFKTEMPENVTQGMGYIRFIQSKTEPVLTGHEAQEIIEKIESGRLAASYKTHREHVRHVRQLIAAKQDEPACPKCGSAMAVREASTGTNKGERFYGCSDFPRCRKTVPIV
ncbi:MAG: nuclease [Gammaproteobacteria bacterium RIFOXYA12_FULL_61_12]|nr:MAG: nuclease [Gammaproteobacteria bacterium RIFOXYA12_FULL_61_12]